MVFVIHFFKKERKEKGKKERKKEKDKKETNDDVESESTYIYM